MSTENNDNTPVTILSGSLGTGKTTILEQIVPQMDEEGKTLGVVNDKDIVNNDAEALEQATEGTIGEVTVDCTCCGGQDKALEFLKQQVTEEGEFPYDNVFFEPTGQANSPTILGIFDEVEGTEVDQFAHTVPVAIYDEVRTEAAHMSGLSAANTIVYTHNEAGNLEEHQELQENYQLFMEDLKTLGKDLEELNFVQMSPELTLDELRYGSWDPSFLMETEDLGHDSFDVYSANLSPEAGEQVDEVIESLAETPTVRRVEAYTGDRKIDVSGDQISEKELENPSTWRISVQYETLGTPGFTAIRGMNGGEEIVESMLKDVEADPWEIPVAASNASPEQLEARFNDHLYSLNRDSEAIDTAFEFAKEYDSQTDEPRLVQEVAPKYIDDRAESVETLDTEDSVQRAEALKFVSEILMLDGLYSEEINVSRDTAEEVRTGYGEDFLGLYNGLDEEAEEHLESIDYKGFVEETASRVSEQYTDLENNTRKLMEADKK